MKVLLVCLVSAGPCLRSCLGVRGNDEGDGVLGRACRASEGAREGCVVDN